MDRALMACGAAPSLQKCFHVTALLLVTNTQTKKTEINHHIWISHLFLELFLFFWCVYYIFRSYLLRDFFLSFLLVLSQLLTLWTEGTSLFAVSDILASSAFAVFRSLKLQPWPLSHLPLSYSIFDKKTYSYQQSQASWRNECLLSSPRLLFVNCLGGLFLIIHFLCL